MRRVRPGAALAALALAASALAAPSARGAITTTIDLDYSYRQEHLGEDVEANVDYRQKYEVNVESLLGGFDFTGAARLELEDGWATDEADTSRVAPTLELTVENPTASARLGYQAVVTTTDAFEEEAKAETYSTNTEASFLVTPFGLPELELKLQRRREYEPSTTESLLRTVEFKARQEVSGLLLEYNLKRDWEDVSLPSRRTSDDAEWQAKATYKEVVWWDAEFELSYELRERYGTETERGVFTNDDEAEEQLFKTRLQKTFDLTPRLSLKAGWEYSYDEDLLGLDYDTKVKNKYQAQLRYDPVNWVKLSLEAKREQERERVPLPDDDTAGLADTVLLKADVEPVKWLRLASKAEVKWEEDVTDGSGASVDRKRQETYETSARTRLGSWWEMTLNGSTRIKHEEGWLTGEEAKFRGEMKFEPVQDLSVQPGFESTRTTDWEVRFPAPDSQKLVRIWKIKFDFRRKFLDLLRVTFAHEYSIKAEEELDAALVFEETFQLNERTRMALEIKDLIEGLGLEGEIERKASDTEDDEDPMIVDVVYAFKLDFRLDPISLTSSVKYSDKGDTFDDLAVNARLEWRAESLTLSGEYQFDRIYADETDEKRKVNLKLSYRF